MGPFLASKGRVLKHDLGLTERKNRGGERRPDGQMWREKKAPQWPQLGRLSVNI